MATEKPKRKLTARQEEFCQRYVYNPGSPGKRCYNGTQAAISAGYSEKTAQQMADENLSKPVIQNRIEEIKNNIEKFVGINKLKYVQQLEELANGTMGDMHQTWLTRKEFKELTNEQKACIESIETSQQPIKVGHDKKTGEDIFKTKSMVKIKLYSKIQAIAKISELMSYNEPEDRPGMNLKITDGTVEITYR